MKIHAVLKDLTDDQILFDGEASLETTAKQGRIITMEAGPQQYQWKLLQGGLVIKNQNGPSESVQIVLKKNGTSKATVATGGYTLEIPLVLKSLQEDKTSVFVQYTVEESQENFAFALNIQVPLETTQDMR